MFATSGKVKLDIENMLDLSLAAIKRVRFLVTRQPFNMSYISQGMNCYAKHCCVYIHYSYM
jgi:hypothetical protein